MIHILFGGNEKVFDGILLCLLSMTKHTDSPLAIYILTADVSELNSQFKPLNEKQIDLLNNIVKRKNNQSYVSRMLLDNKFNTWVNLSKNKMNSYTPFAFLRLFADQIPELDEKIIYLSQHQVHS